MATQFQIAQESAADQGEGEIGSLFYLRPAGEPEQLIQEIEEQHGYDDGQVAGEKVELVGPGQPEVVADQSQELVGAHQPSPSW